MSTDLHVEEVDMEDENDMASRTRKKEENSADPIAIPEKCSPLTVQEIWNLLFCFLAWACNVSTVTLGNLIVFSFFSSYKNVDLMFAL
jgi:hypothetical protein